MTNIGEVRPELNIEQPGPLTTHGNWVMDKFHDITMASEMKIKGDTMGFGRPQYKMIAEIIIAHGTSEISQGIDNLGISESLLAISKSLSSRTGFILYLGVSIAYIQNGVNLIKNHIQSRKNVQKVIDFSKKRIRFPKEVHKK